MVALAVLSIALVSIFQLFSSSLRTVGRAEDHTKGLLYARSLMDYAYSTDDISAGSSLEEYEKRYKATTEITELPSEDSEKTKMKTYEITVTVKWPPSGSVTLKGIRAFREPDKK